MKKLFSIALFAVTFTAFGQSPVVGEEIAGYYASDNFTINDQEKVSIVGVVMLKGDEYIIHGTAGNSTEVMDYYPSNLTRMFKVDGLRVSLEATLDPIPDGIKLAGTPITIISIQKL